MSGKAGISWPCQELTSDPLTKFFEPGSTLTWHYNWNKNYVRCLPETSPGLNINAEFVPMIFAPDYLNNGVEIQPGWRCLLGYNEPDHSDPGVASRRTPAEAAAGWVELARLRIDPLTKLASPAVAVDRQWLREFFALIPRDTWPDFLAIHVYTTTFDSFRAIVEQYHSEFGLPIIITEFAMQSFDPNVPPPQSQQQVHDFMGQVTEWLDRTDYIVRYAWFGAVRDGYNLHGVHPFNRLMDESGEITPLGKQYIGGGHG